MAQIIKILGQVKPVSTTQTNVYQVPTDYAAIISTFNICNLSATPTSFRMHIGPTAASVTDTNAIFHDLPIAGNDTFQSTSGFTMEAGKFISVYATDATLVFSVYGQEITTA